MNNIRKQMVTLKKQNDLLKQKVSELSINAEVDTETLKYKELYEISIEQQKQLYEKCEKTILYNKRLDYNNGILKDQMEELRFDYRCAVLKLLEIIDPDEDDSEAIKTAVKNTISECDGGSLFAEHNISDCEESSAHC